MVDTFQHLVFFIGLIQMAISVVTLALSVAFSHFLFHPALRSNSWFC